MAIITSPRLLFLALIAYVLTLSLVGFWTAASTIVGSTVLVISSAGLICYLDQDQHFYPFTLLLASGCSLHCSLCGTYHPFLVFALELCGVWIIGIGIESQRPLVARLHRTLKSIACLFVLVVPRALVSPANKSIVALMLWRGPPKWLRLRLRLRPLSSRLVVGSFLSALLHFSFLPAVEESALAICSATGSAEVARHCPPDLLPHQAHHFDFSRRFDLRDSGRDDSVAVFLDVTYRTLVDIPKPALEAEFCNAELALLLLSPYRNLSATPSPAVAQIRCPPSSTIPRDASDYTPRSPTRPPSPRLESEVLVPLRHLRDALATSISIYGTVVLPIYDSWLASADITHNTLSRFPSPLDSIPYPAPDNAFSTACNAPFISSAPFSVLSLIIRFRCAVLSSYAVSWTPYVRSILYYYQNPGMWHLRTHVLPNLARDLRRWEGVLVESIEAVHGATMTVPGPLAVQPAVGRSEAVEMWQREMGVGEWEVGGYNHLMQRFFVQSHSISSHHPASGALGIEGNGSEVERISVAKALACASFLINDPIRGIRLPARWDEDGLIGKVLNGRRKTAQEAVLGVWRRTLGTSTVNEGEGEEGKSWWVRSWEWVTGRLWTVVRKSVWDWTRDIMEGK